MPYPTGDLNQDGIVNAFDLSILVSRWNTADPDADLNNDGIVDSLDLSILVSSWGETSQGTSPDDEILTIAGVSATAEDGDNIAANTIDGNLGTRWSGEGWGTSLDIDLGQTMPVGAIEIAWHNGDQRRAFFDIHVSSDGSSWSTHYLGPYSSGTTLDFERYDFNNTQTRWLRIFGRGNELNMWNSITGVRVRSHTAIESSGVAPLILNFDASVQGSSINLQWTATSQTGGSLERATSASGPWAQVHALDFIQQPQDDWVDTSASEETDYWYRLLVSNSSGDETQEAGPVNIPSGDDSTWQQAWGTQSHSTILAWYEANAGLSNPSVVPSTPSTQPISSSFDGQVIENLNINHTAETPNRALTINHNNVTVRNCKLRADGPKNVIWVETGTIGAVVEHCDLNGGYPYYDTGGSDPNRPANWGNIGIATRARGTFRYNKIRGCRQAIMLNAFSVAEYNHVEDLHVNGPSVSTSGYRSLSPSTNWNGNTHIRRNYTVSGTSGGITIYAQGKVARDVLWEENLVFGNGQGFGIRGGHSGSHRADNHNIVIQDNRFYDVFGFPTVLGEGTNCAVNISQSGNTFDRNRWLGSSINIPARCGTTQDACE